MKKKDIENRFKEREDFMKIYTEFYNWLENKWFQWDIYNKSVSAYDYWNHWFESLSWVESYINKTFKYGIHFVLDNNKHQWRFTHWYWSSKIMDIDEMKHYIVDDLSKIRDSINSINLTI